ncbi:MAG TPA: GAF domain-containing sensor histidine kinase [Thermoanaerobaculia bacterium]|jgi:two-component system NarL family sensor kinase|nr:GAF domain-containing sensor histidine kinase [Thermoanaerobaculia bacterium]
MPLRRDLEIVGSIAEALNASPSVELALERTLELVTELLDLQTGWIWLVDPETGHIYSAAARNLPPYLQEPVRMTGASCWCIEEFRDGSLAPMNVDVMACSRLRPAVRAEQTELTAGLAHHASVPLSFQGKALGIMNITAPAMRRLTPAELRLLGTIGLQVGIAIERARLAEESATLARADERTRLAREIHDTLAQGLAGLALQIETALRNVGRDPDRVRERLEIALATARANLDEARRSVHALRGGATAGKPLAQALAALARAFTSESGIRVSFEARGACATSPVAEAELFRIAQQALANVRQHAHAHTVQMSLRCAKGRTTLTIEDDGSGFDVRRIAADRHGILGMRERARVAGGTLRITSAEGKRTRIVVRA